MYTKIINAMHEIQDENHKLYWSLRGPGARYTDERLEDVVKTLTAELDAIKDDYFGIDLLFEFADRVNTLANETEVTLETRDDPCDYCSVCFDVTDLLLPLPGEAAEQAFLDESDRVLGDKLTQRSYAELRAKHSMK